LDKQSTDDYKKHRADILTGLQHKILSTLTTEDIKAASLLQRVTATGILHDKERLERGQATDIVAQVVFRMPEPDAIDIEVLPVDNPVDK
jgi:hypothetical protein